MIVTFGDGKTFSLKIQPRFREGRGSHVINLPGNRRSIDGVEFVYHGISLEKAKGNFCYIADKP